MLEHLSGRIVDAQCRAVLVSPHRDVEAANVVHEPGHECFIGIRRPGLAGEHVGNRCDQSSLAPQLLQLRAQNRDALARVHLLQGKRHGAAAHQTDGRGVSLPAAAQ